MGEKFPVALWSQQRGDDTVTDSETAGLRCLHDLEQDLRMLRRIAYNPAFAYVTFADFELGFDQHDDVSFWGQAAEYTRKDEPYRDKRHVNRQ